MSKPVKGSNSQQTEKAHLLAVWKATGKMPPDLAKWMDRPVEVMYLWEWLCELTFPMTFTELRDWQIVRKRELTQIEIEALVKLDRVRAT